MSEESRTRLDTARHAVQWYEELDREWGQALDELEAYAGDNRMEYERLLREKNRIRNEVYEAACEALSVMAYIGRTEGADPTLGEIFGER